MAAAVYLEAVRAGAGAIDCAISTMGGFSAQPPVETMLAMFEGTDYETHLDKEALERIAHYFVPIDAVRRQNKGREPAIDPEILIHQVPGGMISNFRSQLAQQKALDKLPEVLKEVSRVREDLGYPPLVTPTSQIVGTQAVMNVIAGERYKIVPKEVKDYVRGLYGRSPAPIDPAFVKKILGDEKPITSRPADTIPPMLPKATEGIDPKYIKSEEDIVSYVMLPEPTLEFFKWRDLPPDKRPPVPADVEAQKAAAAAAPKEAAPAASTPAAAAASAPRVAAAGSPEPMLHPEDYRGLSEVVSHLSGVAFDEVSFRKGDFVMRIAGAPGAPTVTARPATVSVAPPPPAAAPAPAPAPAAEPAPAAAETYGRTINAPLVGTFYSTPGPGKPKFVAVGDTVEAGARVCSVEAMKLFNEIAAPVRCKIVKILVEDGTLVEKDQPLIAIEAL
jgi:oxaloacetate decarboxylase alpha subunit